MAALSVSSVNDQDVQFMHSMQRLTAESLDRAVASFEKRRAGAGPPPIGIAPDVSSSAFKSSTDAGKPNAKLWDHRLSDEGLRHRSSTLKGASPPASTVPLGTARPAAEHFPWLSLSTVALSPDRASTEKVGGPTLSSTCSVGEQAYDLSVALNYGHNAGSFQLLRFITEHVEFVHDPPYDDWETCLTSGTTSAMEYLLRMLCNPGDTLLVEEYTYSGMTEAARPRGVNTCGVEMDEFGLIPEALDEKVRTWDASLGPKPTVLYIIPCGHNPTGRTHTLERRTKIYQIAEQHDLIIVEDDPYYFLQLTGSSEDGSADVDRYLRNLPVSYLSLDVSGRVVRLDSVSKILAPGLRCGWMTASSQLVAKFCAYTDFNTTAPSGPSQVMLYKLLDQQWGHVGFVQWLSNLSLEYRQRLKVLADGFEHHLPLPACRWERPQTGMFIWLQVQVPEKLKAAWKHKDGLPTEKEEDLEDRIFLKAREHGAQVSKGSWFSTKPKSSDEVCLRITFAAAPRDMLEKAAERLGIALRAELGDSEGETLQLAVPTKNEVQIEYSTDELAVVPAH